MAKYQRKPGGRRVRSTAQTEQSDRNLENIRIKVKEQADDIIDNYNSKAINLDLSDQGSISDHFDSSILTGRLRHSKAILNWTVHLVRKGLGYYTSEKVRERKRDFYKTKKRGKYKITQKRNKVKKVNKHKFRIGMLYYPMHIQPRGHNLIMITAITKTGVKFKTKGSKVQQKKTSMVNNAEYFLGASKVSYSAKNVMTSEVFKDGSKKTRKLAIRDIYREFNQ